MAAGPEPDNFVDPDELSALERKTAREAFALVAKVQGLVIERATGRPYGEGHDGMRMRYLLERCVVIVNNPLKLRKE